MCLDDAAHGVVTAHEIFQKPIPVKLEWRTVPTPTNYRMYTDGVSLPANLEVWDVQIPRKDRGRGLVADGYGFTDSPDCEFIAGGLSSKGPGAIAIGRQANWLLWGFSAPPSEMTASARDVFLNAVAYMKKFDGARVLVTDPAGGYAREWAAAFALWYAKKGDYDWSHHAKTCFTQRCLDACAGDLTKLSGVVDAGLAWIRYDRDSGKFDIDADAKTIGVATRDVAFLDRCVTMLEKDDRAGLARTLLARYVEAKPGDDAKSWRAWLDANRAKLYFTDRGGYQYRVAP